MLGHDHPPAIPHATRLRLIDLRSRIKIAVDGGYSVTDAIQGRKQLASWLLEQSSRQFHWLSRPAAAEANADGGHCADDVILG